MSHIKIGEVETIEEAHVIAFPTREQAEAAREFLVLMEDDLRTFKALKDLTKEPWGVREYVLVNAMRRYKGRSGLYETLCGLYTEGMMFGNELDRVQDRCMKTEGEDK